IETVREVIKSKKPGDTVSVEVVRKGTRSKMDVALEAFDAKKFKAYGQTMGQNGQQWQRLSEQMAKEMAERAKEMGRDFGQEIKSRADVEALRDRLKLAIPRGDNGEPMILMDRASGEGRQLEERLNALEGQLKRIEEALRRLESRGEGKPAPSGGGGAPKPAFALGL
ncbi:MAG: hypothetical protein K2Q09_02970, partial [Phycisphaerales bacterium]|nr:hypothetical protein [Phycisphaerales bacterium]